MGQIELLPQSLRAVLPPLGATEGRRDPLVRCKFFTPDSTWSWYALEFDGEDTFFGYVVGIVAEFGYFTLGELRSVRGPLGLPVERDVHFRPTPLSQVVKTSCPKSE